jgi:hypothetical protein
VKLIAKPRARSSKASDMARVDDLFRKGRRACRPSALAGKQQRARKARRTMSTGRTATTVCFFGAPSCDQGQKIVDRRCVDRARSSSRRNRLILNDQPREQRPLHLSPDRVSSVRD